MKGPETCFTSTPGVYAVHSSAEYLAPTEWGDGRGEGSGGVEKLPTFWGFDQETETMTTQGGQ